MLAWNADFLADRLDLFLVGGARDLDVGLHFGHGGFPLDWTVEGTGLISVVASLFETARHCRHGHVLTLSLPWRQLACNYVSCEERQFWFPGRPARVFAPGCRAV
jgi:hypothetical protein